MKPLPKEVRNALIIGAIVLFAKLPLHAVPTGMDIYSAVITAVLVFLIELANSYGISLKDVWEGNIPPEIKKKNPTTSFFF